MARRLGGPGLVLAITLALLLAGARPATAGSAHPTARAAAAGRVYAAALVSYAAGTLPLDTVYLWSVRWLEAERAAGTPVAAAEHLRRMQELELRVRQRTAAGVAPALEKVAVEYYRLEAEAWAAGPRR
jgi:hypothetical protein